MALREPIKELPAGYEISPLRPEDIEYLEPIFRGFNSDSDEETGDLILDQNDYDHDMERLTTSLHGENGYKALVIRNGNGQAVGIAGYHAPSTRLMELTQTPKPIEMVNVVIADSERGKNLGLHLINRLKEQVKSEGYTEMIWISGPRYARAWKFYTKNFGRAIAKLERYFVDQWPGVVWRVEL